MELLVHEYASDEDDEDEKEEQEEVVKREKEKEEEEEEGEILPPRPSAHLASAQLQAKIVRFLHAQESRGITLTSEMRRSKHFRNPYFFDKMVRHLGIRDSGSLVGDEYDRVVDDLAGEENDGDSTSEGLVFLTSRDGVRALEKEWRDSEAERVQQQQQGQQQRAVHFQRASVLPGVDASTTASAQRPSMKKRKKKRWDS